MMSKVRYNDFGKIGLYLLATFMSLAAGLIMTAVGIAALAQNKKRCSKNRAGSEKERSLVPAITAAGVLLIALAFAMFFAANLFII